MTDRNSKIHLILITLTLLLLVFSSPAPALEPVAQDQTAALIPGSDSPTGETVLMRAPQPRKPRQLTPWIERTGAKKGVSGYALEAEAFAGPDAAVLKSGFFEPWSGLLTELQEPFVEVAPGSIAGIERTRRYLIVPTGALSGAATSDFFKAGLAEYANSGGVIICFAQRDSWDLSALPGQGDTPIEAVGWAQDPGPFFRASFVQSKHPMLASIRKSLPNLETSGYLKSFPAGSQVLLARADGYPTMIVYPAGSGWVVVTSLFSDVSYDQGILDPAERSLLRDMLLWAKAPGRIINTEPGEFVIFNLVVKNQAQEDASQIKILTFGPDTDKPIFEQTLPFSLKSGLTSSLTYSSRVPADAQPGIHHLEYVLLGSADQPLSGKAETDFGRFSVGVPLVPAPLAQQQPFSPFPDQFRVQAALDWSNDKLKVNFVIRPETKNPALLGQDFYVRTAGQEKSFRLTDDRTTVTIDLQGINPGPRIAYALYHASGRSIARGVIPVVGPTTKGIFVESPYFLSGQKAVIRVYELGTGELTLVGPGISFNDIITENGNIGFPVPPGLPTGTYKLQWKLRSLDNNIRQGELPINILGIGARIQNISLEKKPGRGGDLASALLRIQASHQSAMRLQLMLRKPDNTLIPAANEMEIKLSPGIQTVPISFTYPSEQAGMWELLATLKQQLPPSPGFAAQSWPIASSRLLFDVGEAALLGIALDQPIYYEAAGPVELTAFAFGKGPMKLDVSLDGKKIKTEKRKLSGGEAIFVPISGIKPGPHTLSATSVADKLVSSRELQFIYGARLPDLVASIKPADINNVSIPVGIGVVNQGKTVSLPTRATLYEGDPSKGGATIATIDVPPLEMDKMHVSLINWSLFTKAGPRTLVVIVDPDNALVESNKSNNSATIEVKVPDVLLLARLPKKAFSSDENIPLALSAANLTTAAYKDLNLTIELLDAAGKIVSADRIPVHEFAPKNELKINHKIPASSFPIGIYQAVIRMLKAEAPLAEFSTPISIQPTLQFQGSLEGTPAIAQLCRPFTLRYNAKNIGNIQPSTGALRIEVRATGASQPLFTRQLDLTQDARTLTIDKMGLAKGTYTLALKASVVSQQYNLTRDITLAEQPLTISGPLDVRKGPSSFPRVLVWTGQAATPVDQAVIEKVMKQVFDQEGIYYKIVDKPEEFTNQAATGLFTTFVLFETDELLEKTDWLLGRIERGQGLVVIGAGEKTRAVAEAMGYRFDEEPAAAGQLITLAADSGLGLSGTIPVSGRMLIPRGKNAKPAAFLADSGRYAALIDRKGKGTVVVLPFSIMQSARDTGTTSLYSLLLRSAIQSAAPEIEEPGNASTGEISVASSSGPVKAKIVETLPAGSRIIWTNTGTVSNASITGELTADRDPQRILYLYQTQAGNKGRPSTDIFYECDGKYVSQGKLE